MNIKSIVKISLPLLVGITGMLQIVQAAEWSLTGNLNPSAEYDDNTFLNDAEQGSMHYAMTPTLVLARTLENSEVSLSAGYQLDRYASISNIDTENPFVEFNSAYNTERSQYGLAAGYNEATSRSSAATDTGDFTTQSIVRTRSLGPSYSYQLTERDLISLGANYSERKYSTSDFADNETKSVSTGWQHEFSERLSAGLDFVVSNYKTKALTFSTDDDSYNLSTSFTYQFSELWDISGSVGLRRLNSEIKTGGVTDSNQSSGSTLDVSATRTREIDTYSVNVARALSPSSTGDVNEQDSISMSWSRNLSERLTAGANLDYIETTNASNGTSGKRKNINFSPTLTWNVEENLDLIMAYKYRKQKTSTDSNDSNSISVTLSYNWDGIRFSR